MAINRAKHRKTKFVPPPLEDNPSEAQVHIFLGALVEEKTVSKARRKAGISRDGIAMLRKDPAFNKRCHDHVLDCADQVEEVAITRALDGDKDMIKMTLPVLMPEKYGPKAVLQVNLNVKEMSTAELEEFVANHDKK